MPLLQGANLALRFVLELCMLAALGYWGYQVGGARLERVLLAGGLPLLAALIWGLCVSPKAAIPLPFPARLAIEVALFTLAIAALAASGHRNFAIAMALAASMSRALMLVWKQSGAG